jgi:ABC-type nitrate/sulfonate/bicarbonate transport system substrate-binding protein
MPSHRFRTTQHLLSARNLILLATAGAVIGMTACSSGNSGSTASSTPPSTVPSTAASTSAPAATAPAATSPSSAGVATSSLPTALVPKPLATSASVVVGLPARVEAFAAILLAQQEGQFAKENLKVTIDYLPPNVVTTELGQGKLDVSAAGLTAGYLNLISAGYSVENVAPIYADDGKGCGGFYVRKDLAAGAPKSLIGQTEDELEGTGGVGANISLAIGDYLATGGVSLDQLKYTSGTDEAMVAGLAQKSIAMAWLGFPYCQQVLSAGTAVRVAVYTPDNSLGYIQFGPSMLAKPSDVGQAFLRAIARTEYLYLQGDYHANNTVAAVVANILQLTVPELRQGPPAIFNWQNPLPESGATRFQKYVMSVPGTLSYTTPIPLSKLFNDSYLSAIGLGTVS